MKQRFTKLLAAFALLVVFVLPITAVGQTKDPETLYYETFGTTGNKTAVNSYEGYSSTLITPSSTGWKISESTTSPCNISGSSGSCNAYCGGTSDIVFNFGDLLSTYTDVVFSFNYNKGAGNGKPNTIKCYISSDGGETYGSDIIPSNNGSTGWYAVTNISIPNASLPNLCIKFSSATNTNRIDDILITGTASGSSSVVPTTITIDDSGITNTDVYTSTVAGSLSATVTPEGESALENPAIIWSSSNESVATISSDGTVTLVAVGTTNITASYAGVENQYAPSTSEPYVLTVTNSAPYVQPNPVAINMNYQWLGSSNGGNLNASQMPVVKVDDNVTTTIAKGTSTTNPRGDSDYIRIYKGSTLTFDAPEGYVITSIVFTTGGNNTWTDPSVLSGNLSDKTWTGQEESVEFTLNGSCFISAVTISIADAGSIVATTTTIDATGITNTDFYISTIAGSLSATVSANDQPIVDAMVTWSGDNDDVATIDASTGEVTLVGTGSVTFTARYAGVPGQYLSSSNTYEMTVTSSAPDYVTLPFNWAGGTSAGLTNLTGVSGNSLGDYADANAPYQVQFNATGDYILIKTNQQPAVVSVGIKKVGGAGASSITIQGSANGTDFTDIDTFNNNEGAQNAILTHVTTHDFAASDRYVRIYFNKPSGGSNVGVGPITIRGIESFELTIAGYTNGGGWNLIASPVVSIDPSRTGMITDSYVSSNVTPDNGTYDLYRFNQSADLEWENYRAHSFALESGKGYLYASKAGVSIQFTGTPYNRNGEIQLVYEEGKDFAGWNLIGNPFDVAATLDVPYYRMNENQTTLGAKIEDVQIAAMEGVFVYAYDADEQQAITKATFTRAGRSNNAPQGFVNLNVEQNASVVDNVIVRFDEGRSLPKLQLFKGSAEIFIPKNGKDYAIVNSEAQGEMPVNFKAQKNGTYTLNIDTENVEMNYLHLIDNMTGMDVDLLQTPSYTFDATTNDYASRFRLVFSANGMNENGETETFAFYSNGNWVVGNEGEATLQVIDVNGRIVSNETINGTVATSINATPGVYMLRLVNGNEVKTQKIVVK